MTMVSLSAYEPLPVGAEQYPLSFIDHQGAIVLAAEENAVHVGMCDPADGALIRRLQRHHGSALRVHPIERTELTQFLARAHSRIGGTVGYETVNGGDQLPLDKLAADAPIVNLVNSTLMDAVRRGASDVHIESFAEHAVIRLRIDGELTTVDQLDPAVFPAVSSRIKVMSNLNIMERRIPQDGRISVNLAGESIDVRLSVVPTVRGESIVLRLLYRRGVPEYLSQIGFEADLLTAYRRVISVPHGLVLVTGPTGSGKTTTLNATLRELRSDTKKIITIEDPVEYSIAGIDQIQTNDAIGLTFDSLLRRVLRQDPNIIMVGEIRDEATARLAVRAALTGHLVLSTLHTNDSVGAAERLVDMGVEPYLAAAVLQGVAAQRLVKRVGGGRVALFELFEPDTEERQLIADGAGAAELRRHARRRGMRTLAEVGRDAVTHSLTYSREVETAVSA